MASWQRLVTNEADRLCSVALAARIVNEGADVAFRLEEARLPAVHTDPARRFRWLLHPFPDIADSLFHLLARIGNVEHCEDVGPAQFCNLGDLRIVHPALAHWDAAGKSQLLLSYHLKQLVVFFCNKQACL